MQRYIIRRLFQGLIVLLGISIIVFMLIRLSGDPVLLLAGPGATAGQIEELRKTLGLSEPIYVQYWVFISGIVQGDFGESIVSRGEERSAGNHRSAEPPAPACNLPCGIALDDHRPDHHVISPEDLGLRQVSYIEIRQFQAPGTG